MEKFGVAETLFMSGARATFTMKEGAVLRRKQVADALSAKGMELTSFGQYTRLRPEVSYVATVTGLG